MRDSINPGSCSRNNRRQLNTQRISESQSGNFLLGFCQLFGAKKKLSEEPALAFSNFQGSRIGTKVPRKKQARRRKLSKLKGRGKLVGEPRSDGCRLKWYQL